VNISSLSAIDLLLITDTQTNRVKQRVIACGHSNGLIDLYISDVQTDGTLKTICKTLEYESSIKLFYHNRTPREGRSQFEYSSRTSKHDVYV
jgi:hypothetical protein